MMPIFGIAAAGENDAVEIVGAHERQHGVALEVLKPRLLIEHAVAVADVEAARRHGEVVRDDDLHPVERAVDGGGRFDVVLHAFEGDPGAAEAAHGIAVEAVIEDLLNARRVQDRDHHVDEVEFGLMRDGGGFRRMVVTHQRQHAAVPRGAGHVGVAEHVAGAVDAGPLAVPEAEHAVILAVAADLGLLRAPDGGRGQFLVEAGLEHDVGGLEPFPGAPEILVEAADGGAAIAGDEARRAQARQPVALALHQQHADDGLRAGDEDVILGEIVLVVERNVTKRHLTVGHDPFPPGASCPDRRLFRSSWFMIYVSNADIICPVASIEPSTVGAFVSPLLTMKSHDRASSFGRSLGALRRSQRMKRRLGLTFCLAALWLGMALAGLAHPHVWVTAKAEIVFAPDRKVTGVRHPWTFDEAYTAYVTQGLDKNGDGKLSPGRAPGPRRRECRLA